MLPHPLDRPVFHALRGGWASHARRAGGALRLDPRWGPFAALDDPSGDPRDLVALAAADAPLWLVEAEAVPPPDGLHLVRTAELAQMVLETLADAGDLMVGDPLGDADAADMATLAHLTEPGPWDPLTHRNGGFFGVRDADGRLIAMAGERMRFDGFAEVSGVCTHPDARGRGLAFALMHRVAAAMLARGERPFLHSYAGNQTAIGLYERLGFRTRRLMVVTVLAPASTPEG
jgi:ribosomal protein S18 acetylase RimI-like enzyme